MDEEAGPSEVKTEPDEGSAPSEVKTEPDEEAKLSKIKTEPDEVAGPSEVKSEPVDDDFMDQLYPSELKRDDDEFMCKSEPEDDSELDDDSDFSWEEDSGIDESDDEPANILNILTKKSEPATKRRKIDPVEQVINWQVADLKFAKRIPFTAQPGLRVVPPFDAKPIDYFYMLADDGMLDLICARTNANAKKQILKEKGKGRFSSWKELTKGELKIFLGLLFHMGTVQCFRIQDYWKTHRLYNISCFHKYMKRNRFMLILKCMSFAHIPPNGEPKDHLYQVRPIINYFNEKMATIYTPHKQLYLDEPMVLHRGRLTFQRSIKRENYNYGIKKLYTLIDSCGVITNFAVGSGMLSSVGREMNPSHIVLNLMQKKLYQGYSLHLDKFHATFTLVKQLLSFNTYCTGLLHPGRKSIPSEVANAKLTTGESICRYAEGVFIGKWHNKRDFLYISTEHNDEMVTDTNYRRDLKKKPKPIVESNKYVPSIEMQQQMMSYYPFARKTIGWYEKIGFHVIHMMLFNAYLLYNKYSGNKLAFYDFHLSVVEELLPVDRVIPPAGLNKKRPKQTLLEHFPSQCDKNEHGRMLRRRCKQCWKRNIRKDTQFYCTACRGSPGLCLAPCFREFHQNIK